MALGSFGLRHGGAVALLRVVLVGAAGCSSSGSGSTGPEDTGSPSSGRDAAATVDVAAPKDTGVKTGADTGSASNDTGTVASGDSGMADGNSDATTDVGSGSDGANEGDTGQPVMDAGARDTSTTHMDAGSPGDSSAAPDGGAVRPCASTKFLICEDFESTAVGAIPTGWQRTALYGNPTTGADVEVASDDAYESTHSLKLGVVGNNAENYRTIGTSGTVLGTGHWGRIYYKVQTPVPTYFAHDTFVNLTGVGPTNGPMPENVRVVDTTHTGNSHQFLYNVQPSGNEFGDGTGDTYNFADGLWHCAEWHLDNPTQTYEFFLDGVEIGAANGATLPVASKAQLSFSNGAGNYTGSEIPAAITTIGIGVNQYQSPGNGQGAPLWFTVWIDDVALDTNRITCN
jgi:hypothetical protein